MYKRSKKEKEKHNAQVSSSPCCAGHCVFCWSLALSLCSWLGSPQLESTRPLLPVQVQAQTQGLGLQFLTNNQKSVVAISFIQTSSLSKRQLWVQIMVIKVFILLQERSSSLTHSCESVRRDKEKQYRPVLVISFKASSFPPLQGEIPGCLSINGYAEKGGKCPPWPPGYKL